MRDENETKNVQRLISHRTDPAMLSVEGQRRLHSAQRTRSQKPGSVRFPRLRAASSVVPGPRHAQ